MCLFFCKWIELGPCMGYLACHNQSLKFTCTATIFEGEVGVGEGAQPFKFEAQLNKALQLKRSSNFKWNAPKHLHYID